MTTSGVYSFSVSGDDIIRESLLNCGKLGANESPTNEEAVDCRRKLNMMVKQWMAKHDFAPGLKVWTRRTGILYLSKTAASEYRLGPTGGHWTLEEKRTTLSVAASSGASSVTVADASGISDGDNIGIELDSNDLQWTTVNGAPAGNVVTLDDTLTGDAASGNVAFYYTTKAQRPVLIETAILRDFERNDFPVSLLTLQDYQYHPSKKNPDYLGDVQYAYYQADLDDGTLFTDVYGAIDVRKYLVMVYMEPMQDFVNATDTPYYPQEWYNALCWGLTKQVAPMFNLPFTDDMQSNFRDAVAMAQESYSEVSTIHFQPNDEEHHYTTAR